MSTSNPVQEVASECRWDEVEDRIYQTCKPAHRYFLSAGMELPEFCHHCGKPVLPLEDVE